MNTVNITPILNAVITLIGALLTIFVIPWLKTQMSAAKIEQLTQTIGIAVTAAEQLAIANGWDGAAKKEYVIACLAAKGIEIDDTVNNTIEAMVYQLHNELLET